MFNVNDVTITSLETITAFDITTGNFKFVLDELQSATIAQSQYEICQYEFRIEGLFHELRTSNLYPMPQMVEIFQLA